MEHKEYVRIVPGADTAVLLIHGIAGTPNHFRDLIPLVDLVPEAWSVYNMLLPGHGGSVLDFGRSSMKQWREYARGIFLELSRQHDRVILVGHSMGTLFSLQLAVEHPEKIPLLFLIAVPMRPWPRLFGIKNLLKLAFGFLREDIPLEAATIRVCGVKATARLWEYITWIPRILELFAEIYRTERLLPKLSTPCIAWQSRKDELVSNFAASVLRKSGVMEVRELNESTHFYYSPEDQIAVRDAFESMIKKKA